LYWTRSCLQSEISLIVICHYLLPGQDNPALSRAMSKASGVVVSCGVRLAEVRFAEFRKT
jgi:hypothetical protein